MVLDDEYEVRKSQRALIKYATVLIGINNSFINSVIYGFSIVFIVVCTEIVSKN